MIDQLFEAFHVGVPQVASGAFKSIFVLGNDHVRKAAGQSVNAFVKFLRRLCVDGEAEYVLWRVRRRKFHLEKAVVLQGTGVRHSPYQVFRTNRVNNACESDRKLGFFFAHWLLREIVAGTNGGTVHR